MAGGAGAIAETTRLDASLQPFVNQHSWLGNSTLLLRLFFLLINRVGTERKQSVGIAAVLSFESPGERGSVSNTESAKHEEKRGQNVNKI